MRGASLLELLIVFAIAGSLGAAAMRALLHVRDDRAGREAARGVVADLRRIALDARRLQQSLAVEFETGPPARWRVIADGNGNGITTADVLAGIDTPHTSWTPIVREGRAVLAIEQDLPDSDGGATIPAGSAPIRLGIMTRLTFTPQGTSNAASLYLAGPGQRAYAVRVLGTTQRIRLLCFTSAGVWEAC